MTDQFDTASELEEAHREASLKAALARARRPQPARRVGANGAGAPSDSSDDNASILCEMADCGIPIPELRRAAIPGCRFCVECQRRIEHNPILRSRYA
jgi:hypothetical protein